MDNLEEACASYILRLKKPSHPLYGMSMKTSPLHGMHVKFGREAVDNEVMRQLNKDREPTEGE